MRGEKQQVREIRGTNFQVQNKGGMSKKCTAWGIQSLTVVYNNFGDR